MGIKDLFLKHPDELRLHKYAVIEKLRERIGDDDRLVRETLYQLFKSVIFPGFKEVILWFSSLYECLNKKQVLTCSALNVLMPKKDNYM